MKITTPDASNGNWQIFLLGHVNENIRKALLLNTLTKQILQAKVKCEKIVTEENKKEINKYIVIEAVDTKKNIMVNFKKSFEKQL